MIETLSQKVGEMPDLGKVSSLSIRNYESPDSVYSPLDDGLTAYSCDAACKNCHCATF